MEPFLIELKKLRPGNELYRKWIDYGLSLTKDDIRTIISNGLTYQANALRDMMREIIAGQPVPKKLILKLDLIALKTSESADRLR